MKKLFVVAVLAFASIVMTGCGKAVEIGPTEVGKILTKDGYREDVIGSSKFRLEPCWAYCDKLVKMDISDYRVNDNQTVFMPKDKLKMDLRVSGTITVKQNSLHGLFNKVTPVEKDSGYYIQINKVYDTYASNVISTTIREIVTKYSISEITSSLEAVNAEIVQKVGQELESKTPFKLRTLAIVEAIPPQIIVEAQENSAKRREMVQQERAQAEISKVRLERELKESMLQRKIDLEKAKAEAAAQKLQRAVVDDKVLKLRALENERLWIERWDGKTMPQVIMTGQPTATMMPLDKFVK